MITIQESFFFRLTITVDYTRAFDSVAHSKLWQKLDRCGITGKLSNVIRSMYGKIESCVKLNGKCSDLFEPISKIVYLAVRKMFSYM
jgi:hypothetical protein